MPKNTASKPAAFSMIISRSDASRFMINDKICFAKKTTSALATTNARPINLISIDFYLRFVHTMIVYCKTHLLSSGTRRFWRRARFCAQKYSSIKKQGKQPNILFLRPPALRVSAFYTLMPYVLLTPFRQKRPALLPACFWRSFRPSSAEISH